MECTVLRCYAVAVEDTLGTYSMMALNPPECVIASTRKASISKRRNVSRVITVVLTTLLGLFPAFAEEQIKSTSNPGDLIRLDPRIDKIVPQDAVLEKIADGFSWVEGPVWWTRRFGYR